ncbi:hypothetical protein PL2TA16_00253 [Pseudoalteromonas luteoviolacea 2ta16]|uniref:Uncharacterized protein n=1 Tax=Pseudoalteromonas luteoviolacea (strain 2ta16) TaxID=1353533 RepID=V4HU55_PSEL2|nr:hypothetical protein PL2TA16_00253 [Pseudoalteromonas luteoviolacea 2ta16]
MSEIANLHRILRSYQVGKQPIVKAAKIDKV